MARGRGHSTGTWAVCTVFGKPCSELVPWVSPYTENQRAFHDEVGPGALEAWSLVGEPRNLDGSAPCLQPQSGSHFERVFWARKC